MLASKYFETHNELINMDMLSILFVFITHHSMPVSFVELFFYVSSYKEVWSILAEPGSTAPRMSPFESIGFGS